MSDSVTYILTNDSITLRLKNGPTIVDQDHANFNEIWDLLIPLRGAKVRDPELIQKLTRLASVRHAMSFWGDGEFSIDRRHVTYRGEPLPVGLTSKITSLFSEGDQGWAAFANFWARVKRNPSRRAVEELPRFLENKNTPIDMEGYMYAYKGVTQEFLDYYSKRFRNAPGDYNSMPRNKVSDNSSNPCDHGFHAGSYVYASSYGTRQVIVRFDPANVVRVPTQGEKIGISEYWVVGEATDQPLPSGLWEPGDGVYCRNYKKPDKVYLSYDLILKSPPTSEVGRREFCGRLQQVLGFAPAVIDALLENLPAPLATGIQGDRVKKILDRLRICGKGNHNTGMVEIRGVPSEAIDPIEGLKVTASKAKPERKTEVVQSLRSLVFDQEPKPKPEPEPEPAPKPEPKPEPEPAPKPEPEPAPKPEPKPEPEVKEVPEGESSDREWIQKMNRTALRKYVKEADWHILGYGKLGAGSLRDLIYAMDVKKLSPDLFNNGLEGLSGNQKRAELVARLKKYV